VASGFIIPIIKTLPNEGGLYSCGSGQGQVDGSLGDDNEHLVLLEAGIELHC
jgi:hypothetical protein